MSDSETAPLPPVEPVTGPSAPASSFAPPDFFKGPAPKTADQVTAADEATQSSAVDILVGSLDLIHDRIADATGYGRGPNPDPHAEFPEWGWALSPKELDLWRKVIKFLVKRIKMKDWDLIVAFVGLIVMYAGKGIGFIQWRRGNAAPGRTGAQKELEVPAGALMAGDVEVPA